jgi:hypothetical protein
MEIALKHIFNEVDSATNEIIQEIIKINKINFDNIGIGEIKHGGIMEIDLNNYPYWKLVAKRLYLDLTIGKFERDYNLTLIHIVMRYIWETDNDVDNKGSKLRVTSFDNGKTWVWF